ncbi:hypothetical protein ES703_40152 [subsurface metagenome]
MVNESEKKDQEQEAPATLEDILKELPIPERYKPVITGLATGVMKSLVQVNERLVVLENRKPSQDSPNTFEGITADQKYQILMARASAPAAEAQMQLAQGLLAGVRGNSGGGIDSLLASAEKIQALRALIMPEPSPLQTAMEKANIQQMLAQTRLMNKVAGKQTSEYLDKLEKDIAE